MDAAVTVAMVGELVACDPTTATREQLDRCVGVSARVRAFLDRVDVDFARALDATTGYGQKVFADAANVSMHAADKVLERGHTLEVLPRIDAATRDGDISGAHVDVASRALRQVGTNRRGELAEIIDAMVSQARSVPAHEFEQRVKREVRKLLDRDGVPTLEQQKLAVRFRSWLDRASGMWCGRFEFDPLTGVIVDTRIRDEVNRLFADKAPDGCPSDPIEKQRFLAGLAVISLLTGEGGAGSGRPELVVVVDASHIDEHGEPIVDWGLPVALPAGTLRDVAARAKVHVVAIWPSAEVDLGRRQRLASAAQRRVLRALYPRCAIPDCPVRFDLCKIHHVKWWRHGGRTDLDNLLPICSRHHTAVHKRGWSLKLLPDRTLDVTLPSGLAMTTGPPGRAP